MNDGVPTRWRFVKADFKDETLLRSINDLYEASPQAHWLQHPDRGLAYGEDFELFALCDGPSCDAFALTRRRKLPLRGRALYFVERGPVYRSREAAVAMVQELRRHLAPHAWMIEVSPSSGGEGADDMQDRMSTLDFQPGQSVRALYSDTITLDLTDPLNVIKKRFRKSLKSEITRFGRLGFEAVYRTDPEALDRFCTIVNEMAAERGLKAVDPTYQSWMTSELGKLFHLFAAEKDGEIKGGVMLVSHPSKSRVIYHFGANAKDVVQGKSSPPIGHGLSWHAIQWAKEAGYRQYDFGGYDKPRGDKFTINRFKLAFSKTITPEVPELRWMPNPMLRWGLEKYLAKKA